MKKFSALLIMTFALSSRADDRIIFLDKLEEMQNAYHNSVRNKQSSFQTLPTSNNVNFDRVQFWTNYVNNIIARGVNKFALDMDRVIYQSLRDTKSNVIFSPLSLVDTLAMVLLGSAGVTFHQVAKILGLESDVDISAHSEIVHQIFGKLLQSIKSKTHFGPQISMANGIFIQNYYSIRPEFKKASQSVYKNEVIDLDFVRYPSEATKFINNWINEKTQGKISRILNQEVDTDTNVIIGSALYFSGEWNNHFSVGNTMKKKFMVTPNEPVMVDMMYATGKYPFYQDKRLGVKIVGLPYKGYEPSGYQEYPPKCQAMMYVLLPTSEDPNALNILQSSLTVDNIEDMIKKMVNQTCTLGLPRMKLSSTLNLKQALESLGLSSLFDSETSNLGILSPGYKKTQIFTRFGNGDGDGNKYGTAGRIERKEKKKKYFKYNDDLGGSVSQWNSKFFIEKKHRVQRSKKRGSAEDDEIKKSQSRQKELMKSYEIPDNFTDNIKSRIIRSGDDKYNLKSLRSKRQKRSLEADFNRFIESSQYFAKFDLDALRNNRYLGNPGLFASDVLHKVEIDITETGTVGAAATLMLINKSGDSKSFLANRPFLFFIRHELSGLPLFWGTVNKPTPCY